MGIRFECPNGHKLNVKDHLAGQRGVCPHCQARVMIPGLPPAGPLRPLAAESTTQPAVPRPEAPPLEAAPDARPPHPASPTPSPETPPAAESIILAPEPAPPAEPPKAIPMAKPVRLVAKAVPTSPPPPEPPVAPPPIVWHLRTSTGNQLGPGDAQVVAQWASEGWLTDDAYVWRTGWADWRTVADARGELPNDSTPIIPPRPADDAASASAASSYVLRRKRAAQRQKYIAVILLILVLVVAGVMVVVLQQTSSDPKTPNPSSAAPVGQEEDGLDEEPAVEAPPMQEELDNRRVGQALDAEG